MIGLVYLDSPRINRQVNVAAHFRALAGISERAGVPVGSQVVFDAHGVRRALQASGATVLYLLGHSDGSAGMIAGGGRALDGGALAAWLPRQSGRLPCVILFNTCDAVASGLVGAAVDAGIPAVVAASAPVPIARMCAFAETLVQTWLGEGASLDEAIRYANDRFGQHGMRLDLYSFRTPIGGLCG